MGSAWEAKSPRFEALQPLPISASARVLGRLWEDLAAANAAKRDVERKPIS